MSQCTAALRSLDELRVELRCSRNNNEVAETTLHEANLVISYHLKQAAKHKQEALGLQLRVEELEGDVYNLEANIAQLGRDNGGYSVQMELEA